MSVSQADQLAALRANPFVQVTTDDPAFWGLCVHPILLPPEMHWWLAAMAVRLSVLRGVEDLRAAMQIARGLHVKAQGDST